MLPPAPDPEASRRYEGWRVVLAAGVGGMVCFASLIVYTFSVFLKPLTAEFGWSREEVSRAFGLTAMTVAVCSPFIGRLLDRLDPRKVIVPAFVVLGLAFASLSLLTPHLWHLYATFVVIGIVGNATTQMGYSRAVTSWFTLHRGLALALVLSGLGLGSVIMPVAAQHLIGDLGWRPAYAILGFATILVGVPLTVAYVRNRDDARLTLASPREGVSTSLALRTRAFWILVLTLFLTSLSSNGAITHLSAILTDRGISPAQAALAAAVLGGSSLFGRLVTGWFLDRFFGPLVSGILLLLMTAGTLLLSSSTTPALGFFAAALIGIGLGGEADVTPFLLARYYGLRNFSSLYGFTWMFYAFGGALGPMLFGRVFDSTGSYSRVLVVMPFPILLAALLMVAMPRYPHLQAEAKAA